MGIITKWRKQLASCAGKTYVARRLLLTAVMETTCYTSHFLSVSKQIRTCYTHSSLCRKISYHEELLINICNSLLNSFFFKSCGSNVSEREVNRIWRLNFLLRRVYKIKISRNAYTQTWTTASGLSHNCN